MGENDPRCRMCALPARWMPSRAAYGMYCNGTACGNPNRICQDCGCNFRINLSGSSGKYCSSCFSLRPQRRVGGNGLAYTTCAWCGAQNPATYRRVGSYICDHCLEPIKHVLGRLRKHKVSPGRMQQLAKDPTCEICGTDIVTKRFEPSTGKHSAWLVVDHDHSCCPNGANSCGKCIRGLLCKVCNVVLGLMSDQSVRLRRAAEYLDEKKGGGS